MADVRQIYMTIASYRDVGVLVMLILFLFCGGDPLSQGVAISRAGVPFRLVRVFC